MEDYTGEENSVSGRQFSLMKRAESFTHAGRGLRIFLRSTHNAWIQIGIFCFTVGLGFYFNISRIDWMMLILASGLVLSAEAFNTAIEVDINLTSPEYHPYARDTKDVAAGAVLLVSVTAVGIGVLIFGPHILSFK